MSHLSPAEAGLPIFAHAWGDGHGLGREYSAPASAVLPQLPPETMPMIPDASM